ncbi:MAG TPA: type 4a pilus biogenesis protein PilO [Cellulomonas sp.]
MTLKPRTLWTAGTGLVAVLLVLIGWMLLISPQLGTAAASREEAQKTADSNALLRARLVALAEDHANLAALQAELDTLHSQFPTGLELPDFVRRLAALADESGAVVQSVTRSEPVARADVSAVWEVPVSLTVVGSHDQILAYVDRLQGVDDRLFLVDSLDTTKDSDEVMTASLQGHTFVLPEADATAMAEDSAVGATTGEGS